MFNKTVLIFLCFGFVLALANPLQYDEEQFYPAWIQDDDGLELPILVRHARSPGHGNVQIDYSKTPLQGREASVQYNHNIAGDPNGSWSVDAYARGSRNFDYNRNDYGGGITGRWRF